MARAVVAIIVVVVSFLPTSKEAGRGLCPSANLNIVVGASDELMNYVKTMAMAYAQNRSATSNLNISFTFFDTQIGNYATQIVAGASAQNLTLSFLFSQYVNGINQSLSSAYQYSSIIGS